MRLVGKVPIMSHLNPRKQQNAKIDGNVMGLMSISPNMTILNDAGLDIKCIYNVDTKKYIDNKISELISQ